MTKNDDLVSLPEASRELGLHPNVLHVYRRRHKDFPSPQVEGRSVSLWSMAEIQAYREARTSGNLAANG